MKKIIFLALLLFTFLSTPKSFAQGSDPYVGQIMAVAFNFAPQGWAICNGQILPISQNTALFSLLGTTYGGNGTTNFALPDLRGRMLTGQGQGPGLPDVSLGEQGGTATSTLTLANLPPHTHPINASTSLGTTSIPTNNVLANTSDNDKEYTTTANSVMMPTGSAGGGQSINNMQPYTGMNYIIALQGIFPPRS